VIAKVVILHDYGSVTGGASTVAHASAIGLARQGVPVSLLTMVGPVARNLENVPGLEVTCLQQPDIVADPQRLRAAVRGIYNREAIRVVRQSLAGFDPRETIVHAHNWTKAISPFPIRAAIDAGFKVVVTLHDFFITCPTGGFFVHGPDALCSRVPLSLDCLRCRCDRRSQAQKLWRVARTVVQNRLLQLPRRISRFIGVSQMSIDIMRPYLPENAAITVVRNPVEGQDEGPVAVEANQAFVYIGRFSKEKGVLLFADAARRLQVPAVFIGDGEVRAEAERLCPHGTFTGWLSPEEIAGWLRRARALVFPPLWYETLGLVVVEAAMRGVPAIIAGKCAATDFVRNGETGLWFEHGSVDSLGQQIGAMQATGTAGKLGQNAYEWYWKDPWTTDRHVQDLLGVYRDVLGTEVRP
jgi:glycosyltransferase involved in cell wall biosynthesis